MDELIKEKCAYDAQYDAWEKSASRFVWENATCKALLSDGRTETVTTDLECYANYEHYFEKVCVEYSYYEEFWEVYPIDGTIKPIYPDEFIIGKNDGPAEGIFIAKILEVEDCYGLEWELAA